MRSEQGFPLRTFYGIGKFFGNLPLHIGETLAGGLLLGSVATIVLVITLGKAPLTVTY